MTITVSLQNIKSAYAREVIDWTFSITEVLDEDGQRVSLFLPKGKSQSVADAINAAIDATPAQMLEAGE